MEEQQYTALVQKIIQEGTWEDGRNGRTKSIFGHMQRYSLKNNQIPIFTTKRTAWKTCVQELLWFIRGDTDNTILQAQGVHIWDGNSTPDFLQQRGLGHYREGLLGPIYGFNWRHFNAEYNPITGEPVPDAQGHTGIDQLAAIITALQDPQQRTSRRLILSAWNPCQLEAMALPPCHVLCQFNVHGGNQLSCALYQRSCDVALGVPFNVASYSFLTHLIAHQCGLEAAEFIHFMGNCHLYEKHIDPMQTLIERSPLPFPTVTITNHRARLEDYTLEDFNVINYQCHPTIKMAMVA